MSIPSAYPAPIVFITGGPASGKTTIAHRLAEHFPKSIHIRIEQTFDELLRRIEVER